MAYICSCFVFIYNIDEGTESGSLIYCLQTDSSTLCVCYINGRWSINTSIFILPEKISSCSKGIMKIRIMLQLLINTLFRQILGGYHSLFVNFGLCSQHAVKLWSSKSSEWHVCSFSYRSRLFGPFLWQTRKLKFMSHWIGNNYNSYLYYYLFDLSPFWWIITFWWLLLIFTKKIFLEGTSDISS